MYETLCMRHYIIDFTYTTQPLLINLTLLTDQDNFLKIIQLVKVRAGVDLQAISSYRIPQLFLQKSQETPLI